MSDESSPIVKRAAVTYGRRRVPTSDEVEASPAADTSITSIHSLFAASSESGVDLPPDSDDFDASFRSFVGEEDDESEELAELSFNIPRRNRGGEDRGYEFDWKRKLREMDSDAEDDGTTGQVTHEDPHLHKGEVLKDTKQEKMATNSREVIDDEPFSSSLPALTSSSARSSPASSPPPSLNVRPHIKKRAIAQQSDSESEAPPSKSPTSVHHTTSPQSGSSSTPPTSQEMPPVTSKGKGKQKAVDRRDTRFSSGEEDASEPPASKPSRSRKPRRCVPRPTQKDVRETTKATARIMANQDAHIPKTRISQRSFYDMFSLLQAGLTQKVQDAERHDVESLPAPSSDPIQQFSSPDPFPKPHPRPAHSRVPPLHVTKSRVEPEKFESNGLLGNAPAVVSISDSEDEEMPDIGTLLANDRQKRSSTKRAQELALLKQRALEQQALRQADDDSDLEIIDNSIVPQSRQTGKQKHVYVRPSLGKGLKSVSSRAGRRKLDELHSSQVLAEAAIPHFANISKNDKGKGVEIDQRNLNRILAQRMASQGQESVRQKEAEWTKRGGRIAETPEKGDRRRKMQDRILALSEKALLQETEDTDPHKDDGDAEESDQEWLPETIPDVQEGTSPEDDLGGDEEPAFVVHRSSDNASGEEQTDEEDPNPRPRHPRPRHGHTAVLDSDEENAVPTGQFGRVLVPDTSFIQGSSSPPRNSRLETASVDGTVENETDKENDASLVFDRGEDKENTAIGVHALSTRGDSSFRRIGHLALGLQLTREPTTENEEQDRAGPSSSQGKREPFREISRDMDDPFMSEPLDVQAGVHQGSPRPSHLSSPSLSPLQLQKGLDDEFGGLGGLSDDVPMTDGQPENEENGVLFLEPAAAISPGFSRLLESSDTRVAQSPAVHGALKTGGFSQFFTPDKGIKGFSGLRKANAISLTFDSGVPPSLGVSRTLLQKADDIFEKEQEFVVEEALHKSDDEQQLFVNENGFLTQTRPSEALSGSYSVASSVRTNKIGVSSPFTGLSVTRTGTRRPLDTLVLADEHDSPTVHRRGRLRKRSATPERTAYESSPSPSPRKLRNAFGVLMKPPAKPVRRLEKSEFVEGEAEESDEERRFGFGFGRPSKDDEESDGEDQDQTLAELVDDRQMDDATLNEAGVLEKVKEHQQADDEELERLHRDAAEGKLRAKRRDRGIGFEDSDSEDDDEENARRRRRLANKKRRIDGDTLDEIAKDPETRPFVEAYNTGINDDDNDEFAHLMRDNETFISALGRSQTGSDDGGDENNDNTPGTVSAEELRQRARKVARGEESISIIDPTNVSYVDPDDEDEGQYRVKEVATTTKRNVSQRAQGGWEDNSQSQNSQGEPSVYLRNMESWARLERNSRNGGAGRAGSAVTGLTKSKLGGGSVVGQRGGSSGSNRATDRRPAKLSKAPSALSAVSGRRERFG